jgi:hypothetical protein
MSDRCPACGQTITRTRVTDPLDEAVRAKMGAEHLSYAEALTEVARERPELWEKRRLIAVERIQ